MLFDHFDRGAHLLGQNIDIDPGGKPKRRIGMPEAIGGAWDAARPVAEFGIFQQFLDGIAVKPDCRFAIDDGEDMVIGFGGFGMRANAVKILPDTLGRD
ncbi:hypothetical protein D9M73_155790 [compost metagenome]